MARGPDVRFVEPGGGGIVAENFSFCVEGHPSVLGQAEDYAKLKDRAFPLERGAVVLAADVPETVVVMAALEHLAAFSSYFLVSGSRPVGELVDHCGGVIQFDLGPALNALLAGWGGFPKEIRDVL